VKGWKISFEAQPDKLRSAWVPDPLGDKDRGRTLIEAGDQGSFCNFRCASSAADSASLAISNAAEKESPTIRRTKP